MDEARPIPSEDKRRSERRELPDRRQSEEVPEGALRGVIFTWEELGALVGGEVVSKDVGWGCKQYFSLKGSNPDVEKRLYPPNGGGGHMC